MKVCIFYGSTMGNTESAADSIKKSFVGDEVIASNIGSADLSDAADCDLIILGCSTWGMGELQDDWAGKVPFSVDLTGKKVAVFGTGDQATYTDTFVDAIGILANAAKEAGAKLIGAWPTEGYDFSDSQAVADGKFAGLALDEDNQPELTGERIAKWVEQLKQEC